MELFDYFFPEKEDASKPESRDKRLTPRWNVSASAKIKLEVSGGYTACEIRDFNLRGFSMVITKKIIKKRISAKLYFNEKYSFKIEAMILWAKALGNKYIYGMKFTRILDADRARILQMMKEDFPENVWKSS